MYANVQLQSNFERIKCNDCPYSQLGNEIVHINRQHQNLAACSTILIFMKQWLLYLFSTAASVYNFIFVLLFGTMFIFVEFLLNFRSSFLLFVTCFYFFSFFSLLFYFFRSFLHKRNVTHFILFFGIFHRLHWLSLYFTKFESKELNIDTYKWTCFLNASHLFKNKLNSSAIQGYDVH